MGHNRSSSGVEHVEKHDKYFIPGGDLSFLVENMIFQVHQHFFERESPFFRQLFESSPSDPIMDAATGKRSFSLGEVRAEQFAQFLWVFYNTEYVWEADDETWITILSLAEKWKFSKIKAFAVRELEKKKMDHVQKIVKYTEYGVDRALLIPSYAALISREEPITLDEGQKLGLPTVLMIMKARECARGKLSHNGELSPVPADLEEKDMNSVIEQVFNIPPTPSSSPVETISSRRDTNTTKTNGSTNGFTNGPPQVNGTGPQSRKAKTNKV